MKLTNCNIRAVALVDKPASGISWNRVEKQADGSFSFRSYATFEKADDHGDKVVVSGISYAALGPGHKDSQGDWADKDGVKTMFESFARNGSVISFMHQHELSPEQARVTKSELSPAGHWMLTAEVYDERLKSAIRSGILTAWSIEGSAMAGKADRPEKSADEREIDLQRRINAETAECLSTMRQSRSKGLSKSIGAPNEEMALLALLADAKACLELVRAIPDGSNCDFSRIESLIGAGDETRVRQALDELRAADAKAQAERNAIWAQDEARRLGRIMNPAGAAEADEAERRLRDYQRDAADMRRLADAAAKAREARLDL